MICKIEKQAVIFIFANFLLFQLVFGIYGQNANAGSISFWPTRIDLTPSDNIQKLNVTNESDEAAFIQAAVFDWNSGDQSNERPLPISDVIAVPAVFELQPGESQIIRLSFRNPKSEDVERAYRLQIMEVPKTAGLLPNTAVIAFRVVMPVFFSPPGTAPQPEWEVRHKAMNHPELVLSNRGNAHLNVKNIRLSAGTATQPFFESEEGGVVLPGKSKSWTLGEALRELKGPMILRAETTAGSVESVIDLSGG